MVAPVKYIFGDTKTFTWISSGQTASPMTIALINGDETVVSCGTMTGSGNGHYFLAVTLPTTPGFYVSEYLATISSKIYKKRKLIQITKGDAD